MESLQQANTTLNTFVYPDSYWFSVASDAQELPLFISLHKCSTLKPQVTIDKGMLAWQLA